jgi:hypothetical protein
VSINPRAGYGLAGDKNATVGRCLFADFDFDHEADYLKYVRDLLAQHGLPEPTVTVLSGHGIHIYHRLKEALEVDKWREMQKRLIETLGCDKAVKNPERLLRLPGGYLNWAEKDGFPTSPLPRVQLVEADRNRKYDLSVFEKCLKPLPEVVQPAQKAVTAPVDDSKNAVTNFTTCAADPEYDEAVRCARRYVAKVGGHRGDKGRKGTAYDVLCLAWNDFGLTDEDSLAIAFEWNLRNSPPLSDQELRGILNHAKKYCKGERGSKRR